MYSGLRGRALLKPEFETSSTLISDVESILQHLKRSDLQCATPRAILKLVYRFGSQTQTPKLSKV